MAGPTPLPNPNKLKKFSTLIKDENASSVQNGNSFVTHDARPGRPVSSPFNLSLITGTISLWVPENAIKLVVKPTFFVNVQDFDCKIISPHRQIL